MARIIGVEKWTDARNSTSSVSKLQKWIDKRHLTDIFLRACRYGNKKVVVSLLAKGASPCVRNAKGATPLHLACQFKQMDIVKVSTSSTRKLPHID